MKMLKIDKRLSAPSMVEVPSFEDAAKVIDADLIEVVRPYTFAICGRPDLVLLVDESGALRRDRIVNPIASELYGCFEHGVCIFGDVLIAKEGMGTEGPEIVGLAKDETQAVAGLVERIHRIACP